MSDKSDKRLGLSLNGIRNSVFIQKLSGNSFLNDCPGLRKDLDLPETYGYQTLSELGLIIWRARIGRDLFGWVYGRTLDEVVYKLEEMA